MLLKLTNDFWDFIKLNTLIHIMLFYNENNDLHKLQFFCLD